MGWELRKGRRYYYTSQRDGNKVRKIYAGCGDAGRAAELALECRREVKNRPRDWLREAVRKFTPLDVIDAELTVGLAAVLLAERGIRLIPEPPAGHFANMEDQTWKALTVNRRSHPKIGQRGTNCENRPVAVIGRRQRPCFRSWRSIRT